ncbi:hypothetical protein HGRIS_012976 [Hohenbuehelia grisea]|uniref:CAP-Gly domain-containing protein n=1 Tax=Hohenbuehelia grisea TaxID=104357 RepID=A0ABR3ITZ7_9AGAR
MNPPLVGTRLSVGGQLGTVRYIGPVDGTLGSWLGVEWDDQQRGKHSGTHRDKQYFSCRVPNAGSFIRESANISYGVTFLKALSAKYVEELFASDAQEAITLGSSNGAIQVESVGLNKIRSKLARLERLREVSLDGENVAFADPGGAIQSTCPNIRGLDLSQSLISEWDTVAAITMELPLLTTLALNRNRLQLPAKLAEFARSFLNLEVLQLNDTWVTWSEMQTVTAYMPKLNSVELGYNHLRLQYTEDMPSPPQRAPIQTLNMEGNGLMSWTSICQSVTEYSSLQRLILGSNEINSIPPPDNSKLVLTGLQHLTLRDNRLQAWKDVDALACWCPELQSLALGGNPLLADRDATNNARALVIVRMPSLGTLDGVQISSKERLDSELFYLSYVAKHGPEPEALRREVHPRWFELYQKHGAPDYAPHQDDRNGKLSNRLIRVNVYVCFSPPDDPREVLATGPKTVRVLPTMPLRALRARIAKLLKSSNIKDLWLVMNEREVAKLRDDQDIHDLSWLGIEQDSRLICMTA